MVAARSPLNMHALAMRKFDTECMADIRRTLLRFSNDPAFRGSGKRVPLRQFAELVGVSRQTLYDLVRGDRKGLEPSTRDRLQAGIKLVLEGGLRWKRVAIRKPVVERRVIDPGLIEWTAVMPNGDPPPPIRRRSLSEKQLAAQAAGAARLRAAAT
jgi:hypothetical protein